MSDAEKLAIAERLIGIPYSRSRYEAFEVWEQQAEHCLEKGLLAFVPLSAEDCRALKEAIYVMESEGQWDDTDGQLTRLYDLFEAAEEAGGSFLTPPAQRVREARARSLPSGHAHKWLSPQKRP